MASVVWCSQGARSTRGFRALNLGHCPKNRRLCAANAEEAHQDFVTRVFGKVFGQESLKEAEPMVPCAPLEQCPSMLVGRGPKKVACASHVIHLLYKYSSLPRGLASYNMFQRPV